MSSHVEERIMMRNFGRRMMWALTLLGAGFEGMALEVV